MDAPLCDDPLRAFRRTVRDAFAFLEVQYAFRVIAADAVHIRYESERVFVTVARTPGSVQLRLEIGRRDGAALPVTLADMLAAPDRGTPSDDELLALNVLEVASAVRVLGHTLLVGDPAAFHRLEARRAGKDPPG